MNLQNFFDNLDNSEKVQFDTIVRTWVLKVAEEEAKKIVLTGDEKNMVDMKKRIDAIKSIKDRYNCTLITAKVATDNYIEEMERIGAEEVD
jgi:hypothetical protein